MIKNCSALLLILYLAVLTFQSAVTGMMDGLAPGTSREDMLNFSDSNCDDGKTKLEVDWDNSTNHEYTCPESKRYIPDPNIGSKYNFDLNVIFFHAQHYCMNTKIEYDAVLPTYGDHRPVWAHYGEYEYLPPQRGLHNLEHGAIAMLYHPCSDEGQIQTLKSLVKNCLRRHIITPYIGLSKKRPLALLSWGRSLEMNCVNKGKVIKFIRKYAITHAPENVRADGEYTYGLIEKPKQKDTRDSDLCPNFVLKKYDS